MTGIIDPQGPDFESVHYRTVPRYGAGMSGPIESAQAEYEGQLSAYMASHPAASDSELTSADARISAAVRSKYGLAVDESGNVSLMELPDLPIKANPSLLPLLAAALLVALVFYSSSEKGETNASQE